MPLHTNSRRCTHIKVTGHRCGSPALKGESFCYFHARMIKGVQTRVDSQIAPVALIENEEAIQAALMHMVDALLKDAIDYRRASLILKALYIAVKNARRVRFDIRQDDMIREVPNYAQQYLGECGRGPACLAEAPSNLEGKVEGALARENRVAAGVLPERTRPTNGSHPERAPSLAKQRNSMPCGAGGPRPRKPRSGGCPHPPQGVPANDGVAG